MSVYVSELFTAQSSNPQAFRVGQRTGHQWCHMSADTPEELHAMAERIGMQRRWAQYENIPWKTHYDLVPSKRALAVKLGAIEITLYEEAQHTVEKINVWRAAQAGAQ